MDAQIIEEYSEVVVGRGVGRQVVIFFIQSSDGRFSVYTSMWSMPILSM